MMVPFPGISPYPKQRTQPEVGVVTAQLTDAETEYRNGISLLPTDEVKAYQHLGQAASLGHQLAANQIATSWRSSRDALYQYSLLQLEGTLYIKKDTRQAV